MKLTKILFFSLLALFCYVGNVHCRDYQPWSDNFFNHVANEYGAEASQRLHFLQDFIIANQYLPDGDKLQVVNRTLNNLPGRADAEHWNSVDYWATPMETITTFGGDCEDIAIVKWFVLNHLGISNRHLKLAYVKIRATGADHMVLIYVAHPDEPLAQQDVYVLDNLMDDVKKGSARDDLQAVHLIDVDGNVTLIKDDGYNRTVDNVLKNRRIKQLADLQTKIDSEREKYIKINDGRPFLLPDLR